MIAFQDLKKKKLKEKEALIDELMSSYENAAAIVDGYAKKVEQVEEEAKIVPVVKPVRNIPLKRSSFTNSSIALQSEFSTGVKFGQQAFLPVPKSEEGPCYQYMAPVFDFDGPAIPTADEIETKGFIRHVRAELPIERTGGYRSVIACQRALQEAMQGLFYCS